MIKFSENVKVFEGNGHFITGLILSLLLHYFIFASIPKKPTIPAPPAIVIDLISLPFQKTEHQIVTPPEVPNLIPPEQQALMSESDNSTPRQSVKRGNLAETPGNSRSDPNAVVPGTMESAMKSKRLPLKKEVPSDSSKIKELGLKLNDSNLLKKFLEEPNSSSTQRESPQPQAFSRVPGTGAAFYGSLGTPDYLPQLPDGDLTLLNTKAEQFAVFVRRVATRVFGEMRQAGWDYLLAKDILQIGEMVTFEAVIGKDGKLISTSLISSSGSAKFDEVLKTAINKGVEDKNPPISAALADGNIHFIFKSRSWTRPAIGRGGIPTEQRWLLLGTGLK